jgi:predicted adenylyl cyclase CyaB
MEIEIKLIYKSKSKVIKKLKELGFSLKTKKTIHDTYYSKGQKSMSNKNMLIRIRNVNDEEFELTLKDKIKDKKGIWSRVELNTQIASNVEDLQMILEALGCSKIRENKSAREIWVNESKNCTLEFIDYSLPAKLSLIEIEGDSAESINTIVKELGELVKIAGEEIFDVFDKTAR